MVCFDTDTPSLARATFRDGRHLRVTRSRDRRYPGLPSAAPDTTEIYRRIAAHLLARDAPGRLLDLGTGAGAGAALLADVGLAVRAVDSSREAVDFARAWADPVEVLHLPIEQCPLDSADALVLVDVLGVVPDDHALLRAIARATRRGVPLLGAVARATVDQVLLPPARRAYTPESLTSLFLRAGFAAPTLLPAPDDFLLFSATLADCTHLAGALDAALRASRPDTAEEALAGLCPLLVSTREPRALRELFLAVAHLQSTRGELHAAEQALLAALTLEPAAARPHVGLANVRLRAGHPDEALALLDRAVSFEPAHAPAWHLLGVAYLARADLSAAESCLAHAAALEPSDPTIATELALRRRELGDAAGAFDALASLLPYGTCDDALRRALRSGAFAPTRGADPHHQ